MNEPTQHQCSQLGAIARLDSEIESIFKRLDEQLSISKAVYELAAEVKVMNERMTSIVKTQAEMRVDLEEMKSTPRNRWNQVVTGLIAAVVGGLITFLFVKLGLK